MNLGTKRHINAFTNHKALKRETKKRLSVAALREYLPLIAQTPNAREGCISSKRRDSSTIPHRRSQIRVGIGDLRKVRRAIDSAHSSSLSRPWRYGSFLLVLGFRFSSRANDLGIYRDSRLLCGVILRRLLDCNKLILVSGLCLVSLDGI